MTQHVRRFPKIDDKTQLRIAAYDFRGGPCEGTLNYTKEIAHREHDSKPWIPYSVVASRLFQRVSVAIQRAVAYNVMEYRAWRVPVAVPQGAVGGLRAVVGA